MFELKWTIVRTDKVIYGTIEEDLAVVMCCSFGWVIVYPASVDGIYLSRAKACQVVEQKFEGNHGM